MEQNQTTIDLFVQEIPDLFWLPGQMIFVTVVTPLPFLHLSLMLDKLYWLVTDMVTLENF